MDILNVLLGGGVALSALTLVQVAPIEINPWSFLARSVGNAINHDMMVAVNNLANRLEEINEKVDRMDSEIKERDAVLARARITRFGDEILHNTLHSKDHFNQILLDCDTYEKYCDANPLFKNGIAVETIELIRHTYRRCQIDKSFL